MNRQKSGAIEFTLAEPTSISALPTLVCLHGIGGDDTSFELQLSALSEHYRVISWNMPGYRNSESLSVVTFESLSRALKNFLDELGLQSVHLIGQSIGGMIAQEFFNRFRDNVQSLVLIGTTAAFGGRDESFKEAFLAARLKPLDEGMAMAQLARTAIPSVVADNITPDALQGAIEAMANLDENIYRRVLECLVTFNRRDELSAIDCPVCLIAGSEDTNAPAATMARMAQKIATADFHELKGAGHLVNTEMPDQTNQIIHRFINGQYP